VSSFNMQKFWGAVRAERERIAEPFVFVCSIADEVSGAKGGAVCQVSREDAAILLVKKTHRLATDDEVKEYRAAEDALREEYKALELQRRTLAVLTPNPGGPVEAKPRPQK
jgi:hypothetical protein